MFGSVKEKEKFFYTFLLECEEVFDQFQKGLLLCGRKGLLENFMMFGDRTQQNYQMS
jgi:hypothetical protein